MPAPHTPNTTAATAAVRLRGDLTAAKRLREAGWTVLAPSDVTLVAQVLHKMATAPRSKAHLETLWYQTTPEARNTYLRRAHELIDILKSQE